MKQAKTMMVLAAQWLIVLAISAFVLPGNVLATKSTTPASKCVALCAARCPCCVSKAPFSPRSAPLAPTPSRTSVEKNFNLWPLFVSLFNSAPQRIHTSSFREFSAPSCESAPLYQRLCTYLI